MKAIIKDCLITFVQWVILPAVIGIDKILQGWFGIILLRCHRDIYVASLNAEEKKELLLPHVAEPFRLICEASPYLEKRVNILGELAWWYYCIVKCVPVYQQWVSVSRIVK